MITYKTVTRTTTTVDKMTCDFCNRQVVISSWNNFCWRYNKNNTEIKHEFGNDYPESGSGERFECDMCPDCFKNKLVPFLQNIANRPLEYKEYDY